MSAVDTFRDALFGKPPSTSYKPSREGALAAFVELFNLVSYGAFGFKTFNNKANLDAYKPTPEQAQIAFVLDDAQNNGVYAYRNGAWSIFVEFYDGVAAVVQPLVDRVEQVAETIEVGDNTALGSGSLGSPSGIGNTVVGQLSGGKLTNGNNNTGFGDQALRDLTSGGEMVAIGFAAERANKTASRSVVIGSGAGLSRTSGNDNVTIGFGAQGGVSGGGSLNVAVGREALATYTGGETVSIGAYSLQNTTGQRNVAVGTQAGMANIDGEYNTFIGFNSGGGGAQAGSASNSIAIGFNAVTTASNQIALGNAGNTEVVLFGYSMFRKSNADNQTSVFIGNAGNINAIGAANIAIGHTAGFSLANADSNTLIGYEAGYYLLGGGNNVAVGRSALLSATTGRDCTAVGAGALNRMVDGVGTTAVGRYSLQCLEDGGNNTAIGDASGRNLHGEQNVLGGYGTMRYNYAGSYNVVFGQGALYNAGKAPGTQPEDGGDPGPLVRDGNGLVIGPHSPSSYNVVIGWNSFENTTGGGHCGLGANTGRTLTGGHDMICIGRNAGFGAGQKVDASRSIAIGVGVVSTRDDEIVIGSNTHTHVTIAGVTFTRAQVQALKVLVS